MNNYERVDLLIDFTTFASQHLYLWNTAEAPFGNASPITANPVAELTSFLANPIAVIGNEIDRRPYPQIMRFDIKTKAGSSLDTLPVDPLWTQPRPPLDLKADMPIRLMALIEKPPTGGGSETSMLVFWEYVQVTPKEPAPSGAEIVNFTYIHPATNLSVTGQYWKAAEEFYDTLNWKIHLDDTEQWYIVNLSPDTHPIHVHLVDVHVNQRYAISIQPPPAGTEPLVIDGNQDILTAISNLAALPIDPDQTGPKDTVRVNPGEMIGLAIKFSPFCGKFMYHCHILEHEDNDMMRPFIIVPKWVPHHQH